MKMQRDALLHATHAIITYKSHISSVRLALESENTVGASDLSKYAEAFFRFPSDAETSGSREKRQKRVLNGRAS